MSPPEYPSYEEWKRSVLGKANNQASERSDSFSNSSLTNLPLLGLPNAVDGVYFDNLGYPGSYPFTRGIHPSMYRSRLWTMRQYAGFGTAVESNTRYRELLANGGTGLSVAFDLPTQIGYDSDHPLSAAEVGKVGVAIDTLADMETLFDGIPLDKVSTSMTINAPAAILLAMYAVVAEKQGVSWKNLRGTVQNDILKEYLARGTYIFPPKPSLDLTGEVVEWCVENAPKFNPISISGYHIREAGSTAAQEIAITLSNAICYLDASIKRGYSVDEIAPQFSFFFSAASDLFEEVGKFRAARRLWARMIQKRYGPKSEKSMMLRFHVQTAGHTLAAQQIDNNIARVTIQALAAILGGAQSIHTNAKDEAIELPTSENAETALRVQQILAHESGVANTVDPLGGSFFVEQMTDALEIEAIAIMDSIQEAGGSLAATESGFIQRLIEEAAFRQQRAIESGERIFVGVNEYTTECGGTISASKRNSEIGDEQCCSLEKVKKIRNPQKLLASLASVKAAAQNRSAIFPAILDAVREYATVGEICDALRAVYGEYEHSQS